MRRKVLLIASSLSIFLFVVFILNNRPANAAMQGHIQVSPVVTSDNTPIVTGSIPGWCSDNAADIAVVLFTDTSNLETGEGVYTFFSEYGDITIDPSGTPERRVWSLDLAANGLGLINGKYNIYTASRCNYYGEGNYDTPYLDDVFIDAVSIIPYHCDTSCSPLHRFYNLKNGTHFYTTNEDEKRNVLAYPTYRYEGIVGFTRSDGQIVHRFYNFRLGTHFYTINQAEASNINDHMYDQYRYEGRGYNGYYTDVMDTGRTPVYRFNKIGTGTHFYTTSTTEADWLRQNHGSTYYYEGLKYYILANE